MLPVMATNPRPQVQTWLSDDAGERWQRGAARRVEAMAAATELMLDLAGVRPGIRVLDVAAGTGDSSLEAAKLVGPDGYVLASDLSASMLAQAAKAAAEAGLLQVHTHVSDAQELDLEPDSFDAAICRMGLMFFPDRRKALMALRRVLKPGGKFAAVVWSAAAKNLYLTIPLDAVGRRSAEAAGASSVRIALSMGEPGVLDDELAGAGFRDLSVHPVPSNRRFASAAEAVENMRSAPAAEVVAKLPESEWEAAWSDIEGQLRSFEGPAGCELLGEVLVGVGAK